MYLWVMYSCTEVILGARLAEDYQTDITEHAGLAVGHEH